MVKMLAFAAATACAVAAAATRAAGSNMNGNYSFANQRPGTAAVHRGTGFFDVYSDVIESHYGEVKWDMHTVPLPADIVSAWDGKLMNIVGYEFDIVRNFSGQEVSVPGFEQYNHHYNNNLLGKGTKLVKTGVPVVPGSAAEATSGHMGRYPGYAFVPTMLDAELGGKYANQFLPMGNGAESRKTFHFFPPTYGAQVYSPTTFTIQPMIIDIRNREGKIQDPSGRHGIVPAESNVGPEAMYNGMMECPCTDKWPKKLSSFSTREVGACGAATVATPAECFAAAVELGLAPVTQNLTVTDAAHPPGCSVTPVSGGFEVVYNSQKASPVQCGAKSAARPRVTALAESLIDVTVDLKPDPLAPSASIVGYYASTGVAPNNEQYDVRITVTGDTCTAECLCVSDNCQPWPTANGTVANGVLSMFKGIPGQISPDFNTVTFSNGVQWSRVQAWPSIAGAWTFPGTAQDNFQYSVNVTQTGPSSFRAVCTCATPACSCFAPASGTVVNGTLDMFLNLPGRVSGDNRAISFGRGIEWLRNDANNDGTATITLSGPSDVWFGVGLGSSSGSGSGGEGTGYTMELTPYAIVVLGNGSIVERHLGNHEAGTVLPTSLTVVNSTVAAGRRTVVLTRKFRGPPGSPFSFDPRATALPFINAVGQSPDFGYHKNKATGDLHFVELDGPTCLCGDTSTQGTLGGFAWGGQRCNPAPLGQMLDDPMWVPHTGGINPTCSLKYYRGGLRCCKGNTILLDSNQSGLYPDTVDTYRVKFRWYYEDGGPHINDYHWTFWWTENDNNEHDVPPCVPGSDECVYKITSNFTAGQMPGYNGALAGGKVAFVHVEGHCHIGCLGMELWIMDDPANPQLLCRTKVVYGAGDEPHNEAGFILGNEPCIFGRPEDGFEAPVVLNASTKLMSIKYQNNTVPRYGDMALWEIGATYTGTGF